MPRESIAIRYQAWEKRRKQLRIVYGKELLRQQIDGVLRMQRTFRAHKTRRHFSVQSLRGAVRKLRQYKHEQWKLSQQRKEAEQKAARILKERQQWLEVLDALPPSLFRDHLTTLSPTEPFQVILDSCNLVRKTMIKSTNKPKLSIAVAAHNAAVDSMVRERVEQANIDDSPIHLSEQEIEVLLSTAKHCNNAGALVFRHCPLTKGQVRLASTAMARFSNLTKLRLEDCGLESIDFSVLFTGLTNALMGNYIGLQDISIKKNSLGRGATQSTNRYGHPVYAQDYRGSNALATVVKRCTHSLERIDLSYNHVGDMCLVYLISSRTFAQHKSVVELDLSYNNIGLKGSISVSQMLVANRTLKVLKLHGNPMGDDGLQALSKALSTHRNLGELGCAAMQLSDTGAKTVATILKSNPGITVLDVGANNFTAKGALRVVQAALMNDTLRHLRLSRNRILVKGTETEEEEEEEEERDRLSPFMSRMFDKGSRRTVEIKSESVDGRFKHRDATFKKYRNLKVNKKKPLKKTGKQRTVSTSNATIKANQNQISFEALDALALLIKTSKCLEHLEVSFCGLQPFLSSGPGASALSSLSIKQHVKQTFKSLLLLLEGASKSVNLCLLDVRGNFEDIKYTRKIVEHYHALRPTTRTSREVQEATAIACLRSAERALKKKELSRKETQWLSGTLMRIFSFAAKPRVVLFAADAANYVVDDNLTM